jgi:hypothetical protein
MPWRRFETIPRQKTQVCALRVFVRIQCHVRTQWVEAAESVNRRDLGMPCASLVFLSPLATWLISSRYKHDSLLVALW